CSLCKSSGAATAALLRLPIPENQLRSGPVSSNPEHDATGRRSWQGGRCSPHLVESSRHQFDALSRREQMGPPSDRPTVPAHFPLVISKIGALRPRPVPSLDEPRVFLVFGAPHVGGVSGERRGSRAAPGKA